uniref:Uncharacterized protein n=1 Tax=Heterorhabditis bacteriophora TaxID=37862 RepID=A0A1I7WJQ3_HETBA
MMLKLKFCVHFHKFKLVNDITTILLTNKLNIIANSCFTNKNFTFKIRFFINSTLLIRLSGALSFLILYNYV